MKVGNLWIGYKTFFERNKPNYTYLIIPIWLHNH